LAAQNSSNWLGAWGAIGATGAARIASGTASGVGWGPTGIGAA
jgi:hypothetical protein